MLRRIAFAVLVAHATVVSAHADPKGCYWNAPGLPYSTTPPKFVEEPPGYRKRVSGTPLEVTLAIFMNAPDLAFKQACGVVDDQDVANARGIYRRWGCSPESSVGRMVEGLSSDGVFVWELMNVLPEYFSEHRQELAEFCAFIDTVAPQCFRYVPIEGEEDDDRIREMNAKIAHDHPECVDKWPRYKEFTDTVHRIFAEIAGRGDIALRDRALLESAGVE